MSDMLEEWGVRLIKIEGVEYASWAEAEEMLEDHMLAEEEAREQTRMLEDALKTAHETIANLEAKALRVEKLYRRVEMKEVSDDA